MFVVVLSNRDGCLICLGGATTPGHSRLYSRSVVGRPYTELGIEDSSDAARDIIYHDSRQDFRYSFVMCQDAAAL